MMSDLSNPVLVCSDSGDELEMLQVVLESEGICPSITDDGEPQQLNVFLGPEGGVAPVKMPPAELGEARLFVTREHAAAAHQLIASVCD